jgi:nitroreductase
MSALNRENLLAILELARWAPSGDNTQPWRFEICADDHFVVHGRDTRDHCVYDLDGHPSQLAIGALLETARIAATGFALRTEITRRRESADTQPSFDVRLFDDPTLAPSELIDCITRRSVQRRPLSMRALTAEEKQTLGASVGLGYRVVLLESWSQRWRMAKLLSAGAKLRLTLPEAFEVHRTVIEPNAQFSADRVPDAAVGLDPLTLKLMHWAMRDWRRMAFLNDYLAGTWAPRLQLDILPALACGAHLYIIADEPPRTLDDYVAAGAAVQRLWLSLTRLGLQHQPAITPLVFSRYFRHRRRFSAEPAAMETAGRIADELNQIANGKAERIVWLGRVGAGRPAKARSLRQPLESLLEPL